MLTSQTLREYIKEFYQVTQIPVCVYSPDASLLVSADNRRPSGNPAFTKDFLVSEAESMTCGSWQFYKVHDKDSLEYVAALCGTDQGNSCFGRLVVVQLEGLLKAYRDRYDQDNFVKNLLLDNMLRVDIYMRADKLRIENNVPRAVCLIETQNDSDTNSTVMDIVRNLYPTKGKDFITAVDENNIILVKDLSESKDAEATLNEVDLTILDTLNSEAMGKVHIASGSIVRDLKDISKSYKEAKLALDVGNIFYQDRYIIHYSQLGIGRLIYQQPISLCRMYLDEAVNGFRISDFDEETLHTVNQFFENNLNVSETSRQLYIHRNTLVYRLDKLQKNTGLDVRIFEDAIKFKIAMMVAGYVDYMEKSGYSV